MPIQSGKIPRELRRRADVGLVAHVVEVSATDAYSRVVDGWYVIQDFASSLGVEPCVGVHGVGHGTPLVSTLVPVPGVSQARVRVVLLNLRVCDRSPGCLGDLLAARSTHRLQDLDQERVVESLHLHEVHDVLHVLKELSPLLVLVGLLGLRRQEMQTLALAAVDKKSPDKILHGMRPHASAGFMYAVLSRSYRRQRP